MTARHRAKRIATLVGKKGKGTMATRDEAFCLDTWRGRMIVRRDVAVYDLRAFWRNGIWERLAWRVPTGLVYWCVVRAAVKAAGRHLSPADVTTVDLMKAMER